MTIVSNNPDSWQPIQYYRVTSYYSVASSVMVIYDWALTFGQEFELVWKKRWSFMSVLYLSLRYGGILYSVIDVPAGIRSLAMTDAGCTFVVFEQWWTSTIANTILGVIMITRLYVMYQGSKQILIFLIVIFLAVTITSGVITVIQSLHLKGEEVILSGTYQCCYEGSNRLLIVVTWILGTIWEVLALCLAIRIAVKHFRERPLTGVAEGCFTVLIKAHVFYFASFAAVACFNIGLMSPKFRNLSSIGVQVYRGGFQISMFVQMFVLGPRLILSVREHNIKPVADSEEVTDISTITFQERAQVSTGGSV